MMSPIWIGFLLATMAARHPRDSEEAHAVDRVSRQLFAPTPQA